MLSSAAKIDSYGRRGRGWGQENLALGWHELHYYGGLELLVS